MQKPEIIFRRASTSDQTRDLAEFSLAIERAARQPDSYPDQTGELGESSFDLTGAAEQFGLKPGRAADLKEYGNDLERVAERLDSDLYQANRERLASGNFSAFRWTVLNLRSVWPTSDWRLAAPQVLKFLYDEDPRVRLGACMACRKNQMTRLLLPRLIDLVDDQGSASVRKASGRALIHDQIGWNEVLKNYPNLSNDGQASVVAVCNRDADIATVLLSRALNHSETLPAARAIRSEMSGWRSRVARRKTLVRD